MMEWDLEWDQMVYVSMEFWRDYDRARLPELLCLANCKCRAQDDGLTLNLGPCS